MTVSTTATTSGPYLANGATKVFARTFPALDASHVKVLRIEGGVPTELTSGFTHSGIGQATGSVTFTAAPASGQILLLRATPLLQASDYASQGKVSPEQIERDLDLAAMRDQDAADLLDRMPRLPIDTSLSEPVLPNPAAGAVLVGRSDGKGWENLALGGSSGVSGEVIDTGLTAAQFLASAHGSTGPQEYFRTVEGFVYRRVAADEHVSNAAGVKFCSLPTWAGYDVQAFGADATGGALSNSAVEKARNAAYAAGRPLVFSPGSYLLSNIDLGVAYRGIEVVAHKAVFRAPDNLTDLFDISGQRRMTWHGGIFKQARRCFTSPSSLPVAYCRFERLDFFPSAASAIGACIYGDSWIGNVWNQPQFGWDQVANGIDTCVDFTATSVNQTNVNHFNQPIFMHFKDYGLRLRSSVYLKANTTLTSPWFEDSPGIAIEAGSNVKGLTIADAYIESIGGPGVAPIKLDGALGVEILRPSHLNPNANIPALIAANASEFKVLDAPYMNVNGFPMVAIANLPVGKVSLHGNAIIATGSPSYKNALYSLDDASKDHLIEWSCPRDSSTMTGDVAFPEQVASARSIAPGVVRHLCDPVTLATDGTWYDAATVAVAGTGSTGLRVLAEVHGLHQGVGPSAALAEVFLIRNGSAVTIAPIRSASAPSGPGTGLEIQVIASGTGAKVQVRRVGGSNTTVAPLVQVFQADSGLGTRRATLL